MTPSQARAARRERRKRRTRFKRGAVLFAVGSVGVVFIFALFAPNITPFLGAGSGGTSGFEERVDGVLGGRGNLHLARDETLPDKYTSVPATSGWHYSDLGAPAPWGVHDESLPDPVLVHNLEHAGVGVHYNCPEGCDDLVVQLKDLVLRLQQQVSNKIIMTPYPGMSSKIALTAWTYIDSFDQFDVKRIEDFVVAHVNSHVAPEPLAP